MGTDRPRLTVTFTEELMEAIEQYRHDHRITSQGKAINELLEIGIALERNERVKKRPSAEAERIAENFDKLNRNSKAIVTELVTVLAAKDAALSEDSESSLTG